jgi:hypothetical protein
MNEWCCIYGGLLGGWMDRLDPLSWTAISIPPHTTTTTTTTTTIIQQVSAMYRPTTTKNKTETDSMDVDRDTRKSADVDRQCKCDGSDGNMAFVSVAATVDVLHMCSYSLNHWLVVCL